MKKGRNFRFKLSSKGSLLLLGLLGIIVFFAPYLISISSDPVRSSQSLIKTETESKTTLPEEHEGKVDNEVQYKDGVYKGKARSLEVSVGIKNGMVDSVDILSHREQKGFYEEAFVKIPKKVMEKQSWDVDVVAGASNTSGRLISAIEDALGKAKI